MKKVLTIALVALMALIMVAGCGEEATTTTAVAPVTTAATAAPDTTASTAAQTTDTSAVTPTSMPGKPGPYKFAAIM